MELMEKQGYKVTEVGMIPEDWSVLSIDVLTENGGLIRGPFGGALKKEYFVRDGYKVYEQKNAIYKSVEIGNYYVDELKFRELKRFEINEGDFILSCSGTIGRIYKIPRVFKKGIINQALLIIRLNQSKIYSDYFYHQFVDDSFQKMVIDDTQGGAMKNLVGMSEFRKALIPIPSSLEEQKAIATALSDVDELITNLDKLITKKKALKQGAMQQLLSGKTRLKGFGLGVGYKDSDLGLIPEDWDVKLLPEVFDYIHGKAHEQHINEYGQYTVVNSKFVSSEGKVSKCSSENFCKAKIGDILTVLSDLPNGKALAKTYYVEQNDKYAVNQRVCIWRAKKDDSMFLNYIMNRNKYFLKLDDGVTQTHILNHHIEKCPILIPKNIEEQKAIGEILSDLDIEIEQIELKKEKYQSVKQGMMQELLTGKTRLV